jgi:phage baseplate assembly protein V
MTTYALTEQDRRIANLVRIGKVKEIDFDEKAVKVDLGDDAAEHDSDWIPWGARRAGEDKTWDPPDVGEQVIVIAPGGELEQAFVWGALYSDDFPANGDNADVRRVTFKDGSVIEFDREASTLDMTLHEDAVFMLKIGAMEIKVTKDGAELGGNATEFVALAQKTLTELQNIVTSFNAHMVQAGAFATAMGPVTGVSGPPVASMSNPSSVAADKVKAE